VYGESVILCKDVNDLKSQLERSLKRLAGESLSNAVNLAYAFAREYKVANGHPEKINYNNLGGASKEQQI
jgi:hypothetical protein